MLPITPGGLGVTEGSMAVTLAAYGGGMAAAVAAVLLYRLITYWAVLPAGGVCYLSLRRRHSLVIPAPATGGDALAAAQQSTMPAGNAGRGRIGEMRHCYEAVSTTGSPTRTRPVDAIDP